MNIGFEFIAPTPSYPGGSNAASFAGCFWDSQATAVVGFKRGLKAQLRLVQGGRCCYCRRMLPADPMATDIEHFVEKALYPNFTFEVINLGLSCKTCNSCKNTTFLKISNFMSRRASLAAGAKTKVACCPTVFTGGPSLTNAASYRWVHPHLDSFSHHICLKRSWVYRARTIKGLRSIRGMKLNALASIEKRAAAERLVSRKGTLAFSFGMIAELDKLTARTVGSIVASELRRRISSRAAPT